MIFGRPSQRFHFVHHRTTSSPFQWLSETVRPEKQVHRGDLSLPPVLDLVGPEWICDFQSRAGGEHLQRNSFHLFVVFPPRRNEKMRVRLFFMKP